MIGKLDKQRFTDFRSEWFDRMKEGDESAAFRLSCDFWKRIESDREAIRAETRAEVLRDHFKIEEKVQVFGDLDRVWLDATVQIWVPVHSEFWPFHGVDEIRRLPKKRSMNHGEALESLQKHGILGADAQGWHFETKDLIEALSRSGLPIEVEEP